MPKKSKFLKVSSPLSLSYPTQTESKGCSLRQILQKVSDQEFQNLDLVG